MTTPVTLTYFLVTGHFFDVESPDPAGTTNDLDIEAIDAYVTFYPRIARGSVQFIDNFNYGSGAAPTGLAIAPVNARLISGVLSTINTADTPGVQLVANTPELGACTSLYYDVAFSNVVYDEQPQQLNNFAFLAPVDTTPVCLTDPLLTRFPYGGP